MWSGLFSSGSKRADSGQVNDEGRILFCTGVRLRVKLRRDERECRSLTVWFWIRARLDLSAFVTAIAGLRRDEIRSGFQNAISQRILNCALSVDFLWKKD